MCEYVTAGQINNALDPSFLFFFFFSLNDIKCCWIFLNGIDAACYLPNVSHQLVDCTHRSAHYKVHSNSYIATAAHCLATAAKISRRRVGLEGGVFERPTVLSTNAFFDDSFLCFMIVLQILSEVKLTLIFFFYPSFFSLFRHTDIRSLPDVAMTGNCTPECSELGHSDACWMPGHLSPVRKTRNPPKLSTFVPYQERGSLGRLANGSARLGGEEHRSRLPPSRSAYSNSGHDASQDCPIEEMPLSTTSEFPPTSPSAHTPKREIYL